MMQRKVAAGKSGARRTSGVSPVSNVDLGRLGRVEVERVTKLKHMGKDFKETKQQRMEFFVPLSL